MRGEPPYLSPAASVELPQGTRWRSPGGPAGTAEAREALGKAAPSAGALSVPASGHSARKLAALGLLAALLLGLYSGLLLPPPQGLPGVRGKAEGASLPLPPPQPRFLRYVPSALEAEWGANIDEWQLSLCARMAAIREPVQRLLDALDLQHYEGKGGLPVGAGAAALDQLEADGLLSIMEYSVRDVGGSERVVRVRMMPLIGMLRDPRIGCPPHKYGSGAFTELRGVDMYAQWQVQERMWLLLDPRAAALHSGGRALLLDLGASSWSHASGSRWITQRLEQQGVRFEHVWAWEASRAEEPRDYFKGADPKQLATMHFYNWPVTSLARQTTPGRSCRAPPRPATTWWSSWTLTQRPLTMPWRVKFWTRPRCWPWWMSFILSTTLATLTLPGCGSKGSLQPLWLTLMRSFRSCATRACAQTPGPRKSRRKKGKKIVSCSSPTHGR